MSRLLPWFTTKSGRNFTRGCVGFAAFTVFTNHLAIHGPLLEKVQNLCQVYSQGQPKPLPPNVNSLIDEVLHDCTLKEEKKKKLKFFYMLGHDLFNAGGINSPWGAIIGIPFTFENIENVNFGDLRLHGRQTVDWVIDGQDLINALTISDSAKKFALMQEIYSCKISYVFQNAAIGAGCILIPAKFAQTMNARLKTLERFSFRNRCLCYVALYSCGLFLYRCLKDPLKHLLSKNADKLAAETGNEYLNGGIEYYKQILMKNKALRELPDSPFKKSFDENGNENYFLFAPKLPVSKRLEYLRDMRKENINKSMNVEFKVE